MKKPWPAWPSLFTSILAALAMLASTHGTGALFLCALLVSACLLTVAVTGYVGEKDRATRTVFQNEMAQIYKAMKVQADTMLLLAQAFSRHCENSTGAPGESPAVMPATAFGDVPANLKDWKQEGVTPPACDICSDTGRLPGGTIGLGMMTNGVCPCRIPGTPGHDAAQANLTRPLR